jgi:hypothetical protein
VGKKHERRSPPDVVPILQMRYAELLKHLHGGGAGAKFP